MNQQPPILDGRSPTDDEKQMAAFFNELEKGQIEYLDQANKRIIELVTGFLGILFAVIAFGKDFPPPYLQATWPRVLALSTLGVFLMALLFALVGVQPRDYRNFDYNLSAMRAELAKITGYKSRWFRLGSSLFALGCVLLTLLIATII